MKVALLVIVIKILHLVGSLSERLPPLLFSPRRLCRNAWKAGCHPERTGRVVSEIKYLTVRPEPRRRAPNEFSHSLSVEMTERPMDTIFSVLRHRLSRGRHGKSKSVVQDERSLASF